MNSRCKTACSSLHGLNGVSVREVPHDERRQATRHEPIACAPVTQFVDSVTGLARRSPPAPFPVGPGAIADVLDEPLSRRPDALALVDGVRSWSFAELDEEVARVASELCRTGFGPGDRLVWSTENCAELVIAFLAVQRCGMVWVGLPAHLSDVEKVRMIARVAPVRSILDLASASDLFHARLDRVGTMTFDVHEPAAIAFTSGTSGSPKAVVHSQHSMLAPAVVSLDSDPPGADERLGSPLPLTVLNMLLLGPVSAFVRSSTAVIMRRIHAAAFAADLVEHAVSRTFVVPTMLHDLITDDSARSDSFERVESIVVGGAGAKPRLRQQFVDHYGVRPQLSYGLTEAPTGVVRESLESPISDSRSYPLPHVEVTEVDGELCIDSAKSGPWRSCWAGTLGYWQDPAATAELFRTGVMHTGDLGAVARDGAVRVTGRRSGMIVRGGANIDPVEIEDALCRLPGVRDAAVVGIRDERLGELVVAVVTGTTDGERVRHQLTDVLAGDKIPAEIRVVDEIARNRMGKVDADIVRSLFASSTEPGSGEITSDRA